MAAPWPRDRRVRAELRVLPDAVRAYGPVAPGYVGADFGDNHPVTELMGGVIGAHATAMGVAKYSGRLGRIQCFSLAPVMPRAKVKQVLATAVVAQQQQAKHADGDHRYEYNGEQQAADRWAIACQFTSVQSCGSRHCGVGTGLVDSPLSDAMPPHRRSPSTSCGLERLHRRYAPRFLRSASTTHRPPLASVAHVVSGLADYHGSKFHRLCPDPTVAPPSPRAMGSPRPGIVASWHIIFCDDQLREAGVGAWPGRRDGTQSGGAETRGGDATGTMAISSAFAIGARRRHV